jgi:RsiW-degrading membrane proteinase PrsW (M82 family)
MSLFKTLWFKIFGIGLVLYIAADVTLNFTNNVLYFPTVMMLGAFLVPITFVSYFYQQENLFDRGVHAGSILPTVMICAVFGGLIGTLAAGSLESATLNNKDPLTLAWVGPIEEFTKLIVPLIVYIVMRKRFRSELDGLLFGVAAGMSFAALEAMGYELVSLVSSNGNLAVLNQTILIRGLISPASHAAWTGLITGTLWRERERTGKALTLSFIGFFLLAAGLHSIWDLVSFSGSVSVVASSYIAIGVTSLFLLFWRLREARITAYSPGQPA